VNKPEKLSIHSRVTQDIAGKIFDGSFPVGQRLPPEPDLIEAFNVSRTALREAFRTLSAKGLVVSRARIGTIVAEQGRWNLLDPDVLFWMENTGIEGTFLRAFSEARMIFEPEAAYYAALRADAADVAEIEAAYLAMKSATGNDDRIEADLAFHTAILAASKNTVLRNFGAMIGAALRTMFRVSDQANRSYTETLEVHREVLSAIRLQDPEGARERMRRLITKAVSDIEAGTGGLEARPV
jgi:GntR family transcriptional regulator, galactonate operon transcriptional repressor